MAFMACPRCGRQINEQADGCKYCGWRRGEPATLVDDDPNEPAMAMPVAAPPAAQVAQVAEPAASEQLAADILRERRDRAARQRSNRIAFIILFIVVVVALAWGPFMEAWEIARAMR